MSDQIKFSILALLFALATAVIMIEQFPAAPAAEGWGPGYAK